MNSLTATRTFAAPGYTPARHVRILSSAWYKVTMQNVEHGQGDYAGLAEGTYTEILPGTEARKRRDAQLNHCNSIEVWTGSVWELRANQYGGELKHAGYYSTPEDMAREMDKRKHAHDKWIADCEAEAERHDAAADAIESEPQDRRPILTADEHRSAAAECLAVVAKHEHGFRCDLAEVRR